VSTVEVVARSAYGVIREGRAYRVRRLSSKPSERVAAKYASRGRGYAKRAKHVSQPPIGLPTCSRVGADAMARDYGLEW